MSKRNKQVMEVRVYSLVRALEGNEEPAVAVARVRCGCRAVRPAGTRLLAVLLSTIEVSRSVRHTVEVIAIAIASLEEGTNPVSVSVFPACCPVWVVRMLVSDCAAAAAAYDHSLPQVQQV